MATFEFDVLSPPQSLSRDIECLRITTYAGNKPIEVKVCAGGNPGIVFQMTEDDSAAIASIAIRSAQVSSLPALFLHGPGSEPSIMTFRGIPYTTIQVVFKFHALYSLFDWDASKYRQSLLRPEQFGAADLEHSMLTAGSTEERIDLLYRFLDRNGQHAIRRDDLIENVLIYMQQHISTITVKDLVEVFAISERQLQKRFNRVAGMTPQLFIRIRRVNEALKLMHSGQYEKLSDVAYALNYYDQSHFIRDMKAFSWVSPKHIAVNVKEFHNDLAGSSYL